MSNTSVTKEMVKIYHDQNTRAFEKIELGIDKHTELLQALVNEMKSLNDGQKSIRSTLKDMLQILTYVTVVLGAAKIAWVGI